MRSDLLISGDASIDRLRWGGRIVFAHGCGHEHDDMNGMRELLAEDVLWILRNGNVWRGKEQACDAYSQIHRAMSAETPSPNASMHPMIIEKMEVRILAPRLAVATTRMKSGRGSEQIHSRDSLVMANRGGGWKIVHFHSTVIDPAVVANDRPDFGESR